MNDIVIDTSIVISFTRGKNNYFKEILDFAFSQKIKVYIPTVVITEVFVGKEMSGKNQRDKVLELLKNIIRVDLSAEIAVMAGDLARESNLLFDVADFIIAATTLTLHATLATHNIKHFRTIPNLRLFKLPKSVHLSRKS